MSKKIHTGYAHTIHSFIHGKAFFIRKSKNTEDFSKVILDNGNINKLTLKQTQTKAMRNQLTFYCFYLECAEKFQINKEKLEFFKRLVKIDLDEADPDLSRKKPALATVFCAIRPTPEQAHRRSKSILTGNNLF